MKKLSCRFLLTLILFTSGCAVQQTPSPTSEIGSSHQVVQSSSPTLPVFISTQATATAAATITPTLIPETAETATSAYTPEPTPLPPDMSRLQVINKTNLEQLTPVWRFEPPFAVTTKYGGLSGPFFSPDGEQLLFVMNHLAYRMEVRTSQIGMTYTLDGLFPTDKQPMLWWAIFSPDGSTVAGDTDEGPVLWDMATGNPIWKANWSSADSLHGDDSYCDMAFSPDGKYLVTTSILAFGDVRLWSAETGNLIKEFHFGNQNGVEFSRDGTRLYTTDRGNGYYGIHIWDTAAWTRLDDVLEEVYAYRFSIRENGEIAVFKSGDGAYGTLGIVVYRTKDWKRLGVYTERDSPDAERNTINAGPVLNLDGGIIAFSPGDSRGDSGLKVRFLDSMSLENILTLDCELPTPIWNIDFSPDGKLLMVQAKNGTTLFYGVPVK